MSALAFFRAFSILVCSLGIADAPVGDVARRARLSIWPLPEAIRHGNEAVLQSK